VEGVGAGGEGGAGRRVAPARGQLAASLTDLMAGAAELHAYGAREAALASVTVADADLTRQADRNAMVSGLSAGLSSVTAGLTVWGVLLLGVAATGGGALTRVPLAVLTLTALASFEAVTTLPAAAVQLGHARVSARRIAALLDAPDPVREPLAPRPLPGGPISVRLRGAQVRYRPDGPAALDGIDLDLLPGRRVALTGPNGAGKSTLASVLLRFVELTSGTVTLNGHDLASYSADEVRTRIGGCPQDPHIFDASLRDNLRLARPGATDEQLAEAAARVRLLDWIESLPLRWDTPVGTHGAALSGGQRQRLAVARALLADPDLLILDEPTAHLDPGTRRALLSDVLAATAGRTMLLITHDLDGLDEFDQVITLEGGKIADVYLLRDPGSGSSATRCPARLRGAQYIPAGGPDRAARFT
jgi:ATP-binding cassette subfamily C protein CydC